MIKYVIFAHAQLAHVAPLREFFFGQPASRQRHVLAGSTRDLDEAKVQCLGLQPRVQGSEQNIGNPNLES